MVGANVYYLDVSPFRTRHSRVGDLFNAVFLSMFIVLGVLVAIGSLAPSALQGLGSLHDLQPLGLLAFNSLIAIVYNWRRSRTWSAMRAAVIEPFGVSLFDARVAIKPLRRSPAM